jgi:WhiB family transcriptional regulator, redox-sensing transcriptional regulator
MRRNEPEFARLAAGAWAERGRCRGEDPKLFHAPFGEDAADRLVRENDVKSRFCAHCEVVAPCRGWAREHREFGVWGGESEAERAAAGYAPAISRYPRRQPDSGPKRRTGNCAP